MTRLDQSLCFLSIFVKLAVHKRQQEVEMHSSFIIVSAIPVLLQLLPVMIQHLIWVFDNQGFIESFRVSWIVFHNLGKDLENGSGVDIDLGRLKLVFRRKDPSIHECILLELFPSVVCARDFDCWNNDCLPIFVVSMVQSHQFTKCADRAILGVVLILGHIVEDNPWETEVKLQLKANGVRKEEQVLDPLLYRRSENVAWAF